MARIDIKEVLGRPLRLAVIGGAPGSFIGGTHRQSARMDNLYEIVAGVVSSNPEKSVREGIKLGLPEGRAYTDVDTMLQMEKSREDGADLVAIMSPHSTHFEYSMKALENGFHVICDKPMTNSVEDSKKLTEKVKESGLIFCLTHNYTGYPLVRQARAMVEHGDLGEIRLVQVEYVQGGKADETEADPNTWKYDPVLGGPSLVLGDIGTHAHNLVRFITKLEVTEVCAEVGTIVPNRVVDDYAGAMIRLENGARGSFWVTQAAAGVENSLKIRVSGTKGTIEWLQEIPQILTFKPLKGAAKTFTPNGEETYPLCKKASRIVAGHPEGFPEAFANLYSDVAEELAARISGSEIDPLNTYYPKASDGYAGLLFVDAAIRSSKNGSRWEKVFNGDF